MRAQKKEWAQSTDLVLPWKTSKELPALLKEFPEALQEGIGLAKLNIDEQRAWLLDEESFLQAKNPKRTMLIYKMALSFCSNTNFSKLHEGNVVFEEIEHKLRFEPKEKLAEQVLCPPLDSIACVRSFALHSIAQAWIDLISNLKIAKFQELESKKNKKKKKKSKKKKAGSEFIDLPAETVTPGEKLSSELRDSVGAESQPKSVPYGKTIADEDTRCANGSSRSQEQREMQKEIFSTENLRFCQDIMANSGVLALQKEVSGSGNNNLSKQTSAARKAEFKREKRKALKRKQRTEGTKLKKVVMVVESRSSSFGSCNPLEKASCLSVAGSGVLLDYDDQSVRQKKLQGTSNLIQVQRLTFFDEEEAPQVKDRSASHCAINNQTCIVDERSSSLGLAPKMRPILQYGMVVEKKPSEAKKQVSTAIHSENPKKLNNDSEVYQAKHQPKAAESKQSLKGSVHIDAASAKAVKPQTLAISRCVYEERQRMKQANYTTFQAIDMRANYKRVSKQSQNHGNNYEVFENKPSYRRRGTQSTVTDKSSYGQRPTKERKGVTERCENSSLMSGITSQDHDRSGNGNAISVNSRINDQLLLSESLNLPNFYENGSHMFENYQLLGGDDIFIPQFHYGSTFLNPVREEEKPSLITVPDAVLEHPTIEYLNHHARDFVRSMKQQSDALEEVRRICKERIELVAKVSFMGADQLEVKTYGSWDTGLSIPDSDIDLLISTPGVDKEVAIKMLETLEENLKDFGWTKQLRNILSAQIPVLKIKVDAGETLTKELFPSDTVSDCFLERNNRLVASSAIDRHKLLLSVDIIVETPDNSALKTTRYVVESCERWPELRGLVLLLKYFLSNKNLTNPYTGRPD